MALTRTVKQQACSLDDDYQRDYAIHVKTSTYGSSAKQQHRRGGAKLEYQ